MQGERTDGDKAADELAHRFRRGEAAVFGDLVDAYQERFYRVAYRVSGDPDEALDVVQEAFVKIHRSIGTWDGTSRFSSWAFRIVTNVAIDGIRRRGRERKAWEVRAAEQDEAALDEAQGSGIVAEEQKDLVVKVKAAIAALPEGQRAIVALRHYEGFSLKEIAEVRGCALGTVKSTLHQAFRSLRRTLGTETLEQVAS